MHNNSTYDYKSTLSIPYWTSYLYRKLTKKELAMFEMVKSEKQMNDQLAKISEYAKKENLCAPYLTSMSGNCFFESMQYLNVFSDAADFRIALSMIFILFKNKKNFIAGQEFSLAELFSFINEIDSVFCRKNLKFYKYNYDAMCIDVMQECSWTRLPTQLIMMIISMFMNIKFKIFHDNGHITEISSTQKENPTIINLGLVGELHYIPLEEITNENMKLPQIKFGRAHAMFHKWAKFVSDQMKTYNSSDSEDLSSDFFSSEKFDDYEGDKEFRE